MCCPNVRRRRGECPIEEGDTDERARRGHVSNRETVLQRKQGAPFGFHYLLCFTFLFLIHPGNRIALFSSLSASALTYIFIF